MELSGINSVTMNALGGSTSSQPLNGINQLEHIQIVNKEVNTMQTTKEEASQASSPSNTDNPNTNKRLKQHNSSLLFSTTAINNVEDQFTLQEKELIKIQERQTKLELEMKELETQRQIKIKDLAKELEVDYEKNIAAIQTYLEAAKNLNASAAQLMYSNSKFKKIAKVSSIGELMKSNPTIFSSTFKDTRVRQEESHKLLVAEHETLSKVLDTKASTSVLIEASNPIAKTLSNKI